MAKTIIVAGYGSFISAAVAEKFGGAGFSVALVARSADKLAASAKALEAKGIKAAAFPTDLSDLEAVKALAGKVKEQLGPVAALHWNAYSGGAGDLLVAEAAELRSVVDVAVVSLLVATQAVLPDLKASKGALLVTNGGLGIDDPGVDAGAVNWKASGLAIANAAKHKLVGLLAQQLKADDVYVGEVMVTGAVKGSAWDDGSSKLEASAIAQRFWDLYSARKETFARI
jgi:short-subunit dehydrogenase